MNKWDLDNVQFLLNADDATMKQWYATVSGDDVEYALEILAAYRAELALREVELMDEEIDECMMAEAESVLAHVMSLR
jgi:hypothetical protein